jgi:HSP20 family molecular chaperone IbpA
VTTGYTSSVEAKSPLPLPEDVKAPGWVFPQKRAHFMRLPSIFNEETSKDMFKLNDEQQINVKDDDGNFQISLDTSSYRPDEIKIDVNANNVLTVEAKHEEKSEDGNKHVSRHFLRKYTLPEGCKADTVVSNLSADGVLMITAPKLAIENKRNVPIQQK